MKRYELEKKIEKLKYHIRILKDKLLNGCLMDKEKLKNIIMKFEIDLVAIENQIKNNQTNMIASEIFGSDIDFIFELIEVFFEEHKSNVTIIPTLDLFLTELYLKGYEIKEKRIEK